MARVSIGLVLFFENIIEVRIRKELLIFFTIINAIRSTAFPCSFIEDADRVFLEYYYYRCNVLLADSCTCCTFYFLPDCMYVVM